MTPTEIIAAAREAVDATRSFGAEINHALLDVLDWAECQPRRSDECAVMLRNTSYRALALLFTRLAPEEEK